MEPSQQDHRERTGSRQQAADPAEEWTPPASEPTSAALLAAEQKLDDEIMEENWE